MARLPAHLSSAPVGRERLSREALSEIQRDRILTAATEVFVKRGFRGTTVDNIVSAAKIGVGSFYSHFEGKDDCLLQAYDRIVARSRERLAAAVPADGSWPQKACAVLHELLAMIAADPMGARLALVEVQTGGPAALSRYSETIEYVTEAIGWGRAVHTVEPEPPETFEEATASGFVWLLQQRLARGEVEDIERLFPEMAEVVLDPFFGAARTQDEIELFRSSLAAA
jgi:AcrR family transcriptional regulator